MKFMAVFIIMTCNLILQSTLLQYFKIFNIIPNTTLVLVVVFSILWGKYRGASIGLVAGLVQDILFGEMVGTNALIYMLIGLIIGSLESSIFKENSFTPVFFSTLSTFVYHLLFYFIMTIADNQIPFLLILRKIVLIEVIYNAVFSVAIYKIIYSLTKHQNLRIRAR
ncbi:MAG: rod shape-determining protein MreD [Alkaliphilus sp.]|nr:rod shape-determining protein MreD [Alkaliphilus sp.]